MSNVIQCQDVRLICKWSVICIIFFTYPYSHGLWSIASSDRNIKYTNSTYFMHASPNSHDPPEPVPLPLKMAGMQSEMTRRPIDIDPTVRRSRAERHWGSDQERGMLHDVHKTICNIY